MKSLNLFPILIGFFLVTEVKERSLVNAARSVCSVTEKSLKTLDDKLDIIMNKLDVCCSKTVSKNCAEVFKRGGTSSGVYAVNPDGQGQFHVYCDQKTNGGGWTMIQKRQDGSIDFYRGWTDYKNGFGDLKSEFWLGLDNINRLTHQAHNRLRVELEGFDGTTAYAEYDDFAVSNESSKYNLSLGIYSGDAGDSLSYHRGMAFTTMDRQNDLFQTNCAVMLKGAWWYRKCHEANLNGLYHHGEHSSYADGINWKTWKGFYYSAKRVQMKIRPV